MAPRPWDDIADNPNVGRYYLYYNGAGKLAAFKFWPSGIIDSVDLSRMLHHYDSTLGRHTNIRRGSCEIKRWSHASETTALISDDDDIWVFRCDTDFSEDYPNEIYTQRKTGLSPSEDLGNAYGLSLSMMPWSSGIDLGVGLSVSWIYDKTDRQVLLTLECGYILSHEHVPDYINSPIPHNDYSTKGNYRTGTVFIDIAPAFHLFDPVYLQPSIGLAAIQEVNLVESGVTGLTWNQETTYEFAPEVGCSILFGGASDYLGVGYTMQRGFLMSLKFE